MGNPDIVIDAPTIAGRWVQLKAKHGVMLWPIIIGFSGLLGWFVVDHLSDGSSHAFSSADLMVEKTLRSPSTYQVASQKLLFTGHKGSDPAFIVKTEYDAQNGFGATMRDCYYVTFTEHGEEVNWDRMWGLRHCEADVGNFAFGTVSEEDFVGTLKKVNGFSE